MFLRGLHVHMGEPRADFGLAWRAGSAFATHTDRDLRLACGQDLARHSSRSSRIPGVSAADAGFTDVFSVLASWAHTRICERRLRTGRPERPDWKPSRLCEWHLRAFVAPLHTDSRENSKRLSRCCATITAIRETIHTGTCRR